ncbi:hypothetical protein FQA39_LY02089 [Lamprigera yunnana]|nr:hypothetical protein FQA39_LY02089 [Lamprigera yunnana]
MPRKKLLGDRDFKFQISACQLAKIAYFHFCERQKVQICYCDNQLTGDILEISKKETERKDHLTLLLDNGLTLNREKYVLEVQTVDFLGVTSEADKVQIINDYPQPTMEND